MTTIPKYDYPFTADDLCKANASWGCNCGPSALAFALQIPIEDVRELIPGFDEKRYTSPSMMKAALAKAGIQFEQGRELDRYGMFQDVMSLVRIQWTGPWTAEGANPKWAYWHTHWIATWLEGNVPLIFDCNDGVMTLKDWECELVPKLLADNKRADGGWFPTHIWTLKG